MSQKEYRKELGETLCKIGRSMAPKRGRPSPSLDDTLRRKKSASARPPASVRKDELDHWPLWDVKRNICKLIGCTGYSYAKCKKCNLNFCFNKDKNCFYNYHNQ